MLGLTAEEARPYGASKDWFVYDNGDGTRFSMCVYPATAFSRTFRNILVQDAMTLMYISVRLVDAATNKWVVLDRYPHFMNGGNYRNLVAAELPRSRAGLTQSFLESLTFKLKYGTQSLSTLEHYGYTMMGILSYLSEKRSIDEVSHVVDVTLHRLELTGALDTSV